LQETCRAYLYLANDDALCAQHPSETAAHTHETQQR
jgi:hypothetical protein